MNLKLHRNPIFDIMIVSLDFILVFLSYEITTSFLNSFYDAGSINKYLIALYAFLVIFMLYSYELYTKVIRNKYELFLSTGLSILAANILVFILKSFVSLETGSQFHFLVMPVILLNLTISSKLIILEIVKKIEGVSKLLVIESKDVENTLARKVKYSYLDLHEAWYILIDINSKEEIDDLVNEKFKDYESIFISHSIPDPLRDFFISRAITMGLGIYIMPNLYNINVLKSEIVQFDDTPAIRIQAFGLTKLQKIIKRVFDIFVSTVAIIITSPIMLACAVAIKIDSEGPVIYKQERWTLNQKPFYIKKFRTMKVDAEKETGAVLSIDNDPRITRVGRILRKYRIDELPQFFNILFGSMSVVGPRPERPEFITTHLNEIDDYDKRFFTKAGLTGLAQVYANYDTTTNDKLSFDILYIRDYSFWMDIKLVLLTLKIIFIKESSEGVKPTPNYTNTGTTINH